jgi:hypothetical protein
MKWEPAAFLTQARDRLWGSVWGRWGVCHRSRRRYVVYLILGPRLTEFDSLRCARRFCEAIEPLTDWSRPHAELSADNALGLALHRTALRLTRGHPALSVVSAIRTAPDDDGNGGARP